MEIARQITCLENSRLNSLVLQMVSVFVFERNDTLGGGGGVKY